MTDPMHQPCTLAEVGARLIENGYCPVPIPPGTKGPRTKGWPDLKADQRTLRRWIKRGYGEYGVGIIASETPGVDLDISDERILAQVLEWCKKHIGVVAKRTGRPPRVLFPCRADRPLKYDASAKFQSPDGATHQIEFLSGRTQYAAYAVHPGTGKPYAWEGDDPLATHVDLLPTITQDLATLLLEHFESIAPAEWKVIERAKTNRERERTGNPKKTAPVPKLQSAMEFLPNEDVPRKVWIDVAHALWAAVGDDKTSGFEIFDDWSGKSEKYNAETTVREWDGIKKVDSLGAGTIFRMAYEAGWRMPAQLEFEVIEIDEVCGAIARAVANERARLSQPAEVTEEGDSAEDAVGDPGEDADAEAAHPEPEKAEGASERATPRFRSIAFAEAADHALERSAEPLIDDILDQGTVGVIYGRSNSGKTFAALDIAASIATGRPWTGRDVATGAVLYIAAEGGGGIFKRFAALQRKQKVSPGAPLHLAACPVDLFNPAADLKAVASEARRVGKVTGQPLRLIVVDTLARSMGGG